MDAFQKFSQGICRLLQRSHVPIVVARTSSIPDAGNGVYATKNVLAGEIICLYPGIYCPGLPPWTSSMNSFDDDSVEFLGGTITPSGLHSDDNAYIMNIQTPTGGYIDGCALEIGIVPSSTSFSREIRRLDENPSCCAHLVNHSLARSNVEVFPFLWTDILMQNYFSNDMFDLPNVLRRDRFPWYFANSEIVYYGDIHASSTSSTSAELICGAALFAKSHITKDSELFLDYQLQEPLPLWATKWYNTNP